MDKRELEIILVDQSKELEKLSDRKICRRREEDLVDLESNLAQVVIGVRRSGKSTLCYDVLHRSGVKFAYVNFDDERLAKLTSDDLNDVLEVLYKIYGDFTHLFLDEIQNVDGWQLFVNRLLRQDIHILVTGSNAKLLSDDLATHLTGRHSRIPLYPFSFSEYCEIKGVDTKSIATKEEGLRRAAFDEYVRDGGFPEILKIRDKAGYINELVENVLKRDIEQRYRIHYKATFEQLSQHLLNETPKVVIYDDLQKLFSIKSLHTVKEYVGYLKRAFLLIGIHKYSSKSKVRIVGEKVYPIDVALMDKRENAFSGQNLGWRLETIVLLELKRRCEQKYHDIYYYSDRSGECDFMICNGNTPIQAIQVSYDISNPKTRNRELKGLILAAKKAGCKDLLLLTDHEYSDTKFDGYPIHIRPVYSWVLGL